MTTEKLQEAVAAGFELVASLAATVLDPRDGRILALRALVEELSTEEENRTRVDPRPTDL